MPSVVTESSAVSAVALEHLLEQTPFTRQLGFRLIAIEHGLCSIGAPFKPEFERPGGVVSGQVFVAAADVAMWLAIKTQLGLEDGSVTADMSTVFLNPARQEGFRCTASVLKWGRRLIVGTAECVNESGQRLTQHTITYVRHTITSE
jgi:uncharacterized protein (TIGR00369 family)